MSRRFRQRLFCYRTLLAPQAMAQVAGHSVMSHGITKPLPTTGWNACALPQGAVMSIAWET